MPVEFLGIAATNDGSEVSARTGGSFDKDYTLRLALAHEEHGWDRVLFAYGSGAPDPNAAAAYVASKTRTLQLLLAHRPNVSYPTFAAKTFATIDQISGGRVAVHFITGGTDHEQQREGDYLTKDERYARTRECMAIVKQAWTSREPFDHEGPHYRFANFVSDIFPVQQPRPRVSFGGSSPAAYQAGGAEADIYCLWGEPLANTAEQIESVKAAARAAGRTDMPKIQAAFRPIIAPTEEKAWAKAHRIVDRIQARIQAGGTLSRRRPSRTRRTPGPSGCWPSPRRENGSTAPCGPAPRPSLAARATPTRSSARRKQWRWPFSTTSSWAWTSSPCAATTCWPTPSTSASR